MSQEQRQWHRWFGMCWTDFFFGTPATVEMEKDLSLKQQRLDVVVVRKGLAQWPDDLPDGFDGMAEHNLISFKSYQEALDGFALRELDAHSVNYRKQVSPDIDDLVSEDNFRLFAVCVRRPDGLMGKATLERIRAGVYRVRFFDSELRVIVVHELPQTPNNAMLHLFSHKTALVQYGQQSYRRRSEETSLFLNRLFGRYQEEGVMSFTWEQGIREAKAEILSHIPVKERLEGVPVEEVLKAVPLEEVLKAVPVEQLSPEAKAELIRRLQGGAPSSGAGK